VIYAEVLKRFP